MYELIYREDRVADLEVQPTIHSLTNIPCFEAITVKVVVQVTWYK